MTTHTSTASTRAHAIAQPPENSDVIRHVWRHKYYDIIAVQYMNRFVLPSSAIETMLFCILYLWGIAVKIKAVSWENQPKTQ